MHIRYFDDFNEAATGLASSNTKGVLAYAEDINLFERTAILSGAADRLSKGGCDFFAFAGPCCEMAHDMIDDVLEAEGATHVVTTWHTEEKAEEVVDFVLVHARLSQIRELLVILPGRSEYESELKNQMKARANIASEI